MILYMCLQKLRTPKGLAMFADQAKLSNKNQVLFAMQQLQRLFGATWTECVWSIVDASESPVKFIVSDHPVTVCNSGCFPGSAVCRGYNDPDVRLTGTHTIFPLSLEKALILTNLSWVRNPYTSPTKLRPNPVLLRPTIFSFTHIQTGRNLSETEVEQINFVIKERALRYVAAAENDWLYPERAIPTQQWDRLGDGYLFMPDPRSVSFTTGIFMKFASGRREAYDEYGRRPGQAGYDSDRSVESDTFLAFQGEYARVFGPRRRGLTFDYGRITPQEDTPDFHAYHLQLERKKPPNALTKRRRSGK